jgi:hypothetical protein
MNPRIRILQPAGTWVLFCFLFISGCNNEQKELKIFSSSDNAMVGFSIQEINKELAEYNISVLPGVYENADISFIIQSDHDQIKPEGFKILITDKNKIQIIASDAAGAMYGGLELAEQIRISGLKSVEETTQNPYMLIRGTKFNIPLDVRTPSYTDPCDAAQKNMPEMWNLEFWKEYIDNLARYRFNLISLWSLHPFPSMVKVPGYEDIALNNVERSLVEWEELYNSNGIGFDDPSIINNTEVLKEISIDEKIEFWKEVMAYGKSRNIRFYIVTWNIFVNGTEGKYGITDKIDNPVTRDYFRESIKQMFITYPDLAGIGLTAGENMNGSSSVEKEDWAFETYAMGLMDAAIEMPDRDFTFIHRQHMTGAKEIHEKFRPLIELDNIEFLFSFKYAQAHVMSSVVQPFSKRFVKDIEGMKTLWTLRNDDNYIYRWGAPDFVREFIKNIPFQVSKGFYYGSDQWVWGRDFLTKNSGNPRELEIVKHWYQWMLWGRLGYNPEMTNERYMEILKSRFPDAGSENLFEAWQSASMIYPVTTGFHWGALDFQWYIEGCKSTPAFARNKTGFHDVNSFINLPPHPGTNFQSIPAYVKSVVEADPSDSLLTPLTVAGRLHKHSDNAIRAVEKIKPGNDIELKRTLHDIKTMAALGKYYAHKIAGSTYVALYRETGEVGYQSEAVDELNGALTAWKQYAQLAMEQNHFPLWTNRVGYVDLVRITGWVEEDIHIAQSKITSDHAP